MRKKFKFGDLNSNLNAAYTGAATFGRDYTFFVSVFTLIICVIAIIAGIYLINRKPVFTIKTNFTVSTVNEIDSVYTDQNSTYKSTSYNLTGTIASCGNSVFTLSDYPYKIEPGKTISVYIRDCNSNEAHYRSDDTKGAGWIVIGISIVAIIFTLVRLFLVKKYKGIAAIQGVSGVSNLFRGKF